MREGAQTEALARQAESLDNLRAAMTWAQQRGESALMAAFGAATAQFWKIRGPFREGAEHLRHAVEGARNLRELQMLAQLLSDYGSLLCLHGEHARARPLYEEALTLWRDQNDQAGVARALNNLGNVADVLGEPEEAAICHMKSLALRRALGDEPGIGATINNLALLARKRGDYTEAARLLEEAWSVYQRLNDLHRAAIALNNLADVTADQGDLERAERLYLRCGALYEQIGDRCGLATVTSGLADIAAQRGDREQARRLYTRSLEDYEAVGDQRALASARARLDELEEKREEAAAPAIVSAPAHAVTFGETAAPNPTLLFSPKQTRASNSPPRLSVRLLGGFSLEPADPSLRLPGWSRRSHRMLLQYLCLHPDIPAPRALLSELLWPQLEAAAAQHALRKALSETRTVLAPLGESETFLSISRDAICLHTQAGIEVDVIAFRRLVAESTVHEATGFTDSVQQSLLQADALYRGELLPEERTAEWVEEERRRLADLHTAVLLTLARYAHRAENWSEVERFTERLLAVDPCLESACRLRMVALSRQGRRAEALRAYETCREALREELALAPSARTLAVVEQIRALGTEVSQ
jgi:DNA-binding SARP family transcriptional activator/Tfp pilus assembly protein PilF